MYCFPCNLHIENEHLSWEGHVGLIQKQGEFCEAEITGRGAHFHVIIGPQMNGHFLCIPNWEVGCELSTLDDVFWNTGQVRKHLPPEDTVTVVHGLAALKRLLDF